jgi:hypothetical protein
LFPDKRPIGIDPTGRVVLLYLATGPVSHRFSAYLQRHFELLRHLPSWTLRMVVPPLLEHVGRKYLETANEDLTVRLRPETVEELRWYFEERRKAPQAEARPDQKRLDSAALAFDTPRYRVLYRRWLSDGDTVFGFVSSGGLSDALMRRVGCIESIVLRHQYGHLAPLVSATVRKPTGAEQGERLRTSPRPLPLAQPRIELSSDASHADAPIAPGQPSLR